MDLSLIIVIIISVIIFIFMVGENANISRCPYPNGNCFDGNGKYQYKGRGCRKDSVGTLLSRIDWLSKHASDKPLYTTSYIIAFVLSLGVLITLYATSGYTLSAWEYVIILIISFIIVFSITNLLDFHTNRYPAYYIRKNIKYLGKKLSCNVRDPPEPCSCCNVPHRTKLRDILKM